MTKQEYLTCPICAAQTKDYFLSTSGSLITDVRCTNRKCFFSSNYVPINVWDRYMHMVERCYSLEAENTNIKAEIAQLQADNRSLVEQANQMALKPNQAIIERHEYDHDNPETYPPKRRSYLCETISGFVELFWNPIGQEWHIAIGMNDIYNHFQINAYYTWVYPPQRNDK